MEERSTIAAQITAPGYSAISVVRISGSKAFPLLRELAGIEPEHHRLAVRDIVHENELLDKCVIAFFKGPHSYTGEDMVEISLHGGIASVKRFLTVLYSMGISPAQRGEFTRRAFLNGKMDLIQAEAVLSVIEARTVEGLNRALQNSSGGFSALINNMRSDLIDLKSYIDGSIDFPDDVDYEEKGFSAMMDNIRKLLSDISSGIDSGIAMTSGIRVLITGRSNTGKSTIFNRLLKEDRAIVTDEAGTTRDIISEWIKIGQFPVLLMDSAGVRETGTAAEKIGIERTFTEIGNADIVIFVFDASEGFTAEDSALYERIKHKRHIVLGNKTDKGISDSGMEFIPVSALNDSSMAEIINDRILDITGFDSGFVPMVMNSREADIVSRLEAVSSNIQFESMRSSPEILSSMLDDMIRLTGELTDSITEEDILDNIFSRFCIGK